MSKKKKKDWKKELIVLVISLALMFLITNYGQEIEAYANNYLNISIFDFSENEVAQSDNLVIETTGVGSNHHKYKFIICYYK